MVIAIAILNISNLKKNANYLMLYTFLHLWYTFFLERNVTGASVRYGMFSLSVSSQDIYFFCHDKNRSSGFSTMSDTSLPVQSQKMAGGLEFQIQAAEEFNYLCSENKGADQLCNYCTADLRLCFRIRKNLFFFSSQDIYLSCRLLICVCLAMSFSN